jgi:hypothetical protein
MTSYRLRGRISKFWAVSTFSTLRQTGLVPEKTRSFRPTHTVQTTWTRREAGKAHGGFALSGARRPPSIHAINFF